MLRFFPSVRQICDFGLARGVEDEQTGGLTEYVVTRWYRAPEIMLACQEYSSAIDMWSVGCIFAELLARTPLFPGEDYIAQLRLICDKLGRPSDKELDFVTSERARRFMNSLPNKASPAFTEMFSAHKDEKEALDLVKRMLEIHPKKRITVEEALEHPFLESLHSPDDEPVNSTGFSFEFENEDLSRERVQELIWEEIREYHPDLPETFPSSTPRRRSKNAAADSKAEAKGASGDHHHNEEESNRDDKDSDAKAAKKRLITPEGGAKK
jgi:serine/threonine protein kinase